MRYAKCKVPCTGAKLHLHNEQRRNIQYLKVKAAVFWPIRIDLATGLFQLPESRCNAFLRGLGVAGCCVKRLGDDIRRPGKQTEFAVRLRPFLLLRGRWTTRIRRQHCQFLQAQAEILLEIQLLAPGGNSLVRLQQCKCDDTKSNNSKDLRSHDGTPSLGRRTCASKFATGLAGATQKEKIVNDNR